MSVRTSATRIGLALAAVLAGTTMVATSGAPASAGIAPRHGIVARIEHAVQARDGSVTVTGWAFRGSRPNRHMRICIWSSQRCQRRVYTRIWRPAINAEYHVRADHGFRVTLPRTAVGSIVSLHDYPAGSPEVARSGISRPGARIVAEAKKFVGKAPYRSGGASPSGFDCSGYTMYVYEHANVSSLPHNSEAQRHGTHMRRITYRSHARPGDLVFYLSGGSAFHVAIYAGHGMQYAATEPGQRVRYQHIWSSAVEFRSNWH